MKINYNNNPETRGIKGFVVFVVTLLLLFFVLSKGALAADTTKTDTASAPVQIDTVHQVLNELKAGNEDSPVMAVMMIVAIIGVVGLALFLSFRGDDKAPVKKKRT